jgi:hypothetical protein
MSAEDYNDHSKALPVGSKVEYHGSMEYGWGDYKVVYVSAPNPWSPKEEYEGGVAYSLASWNDPDEEIQFHNVRRKSISLLQLPTYTDRSEVANPKRSKVI